jgi:hypothetical protein
MELDEILVEVRLDIGVDGAVNLLALLDQVAPRFSHRGLAEFGRASRSVTHGTDSWWSPRIVWAFYPQSAFDPQAGFV